MKNKITYDEAHRAFRYDKETGKLYWKISTNSSIIIGKEAGSINTKGKNKYIHVQIYGVLYEGHRIIWLMLYGKWPDNFIDHIDRNGLNNRPENLRDVQNSINLKNRRLQRNSTSGHNGIRIFDSKYLGKRYRVIITINNKKQVSFGTYSTLDEALKVRDVKQIEYGYTEQHGKLDDK